jgi:FMN phosphatase YigB (HAD superfamily)
MIEVYRDIDILGEKLTQAGIDAVLLDLDDTLIDTNKLFGTQMRRFVSAVVEKNPNLDWRKVFAKFVELNDGAYATLSVQKGKFAVVARKLDNHFETFPLFSTHGDIPGRIFRRVPPMFEGSRKILDTFVALNRPIALATHGNYGWSNRKIDAHDLRHYFAHIEIVNEKSFKGPDDWLKAVKALGIHPSRALIIGDNLRGDIISTFEIGVEHGVWIESPYLIYNEGAIPKGVIKVKNVGEVFEALINKL